MVLEPGMAVEGPEEKWGVKGTALVMDKYQAYLEPLDLQASMIRCLLHGGAAEQGELHCLRGSKKY